MLHITCLVISTLLRCLWTSHRCISILFWMPVKSLLFEPLQVHRPHVGTDPFSTELVLERGNADWFLGSRSPNIKFQPGIFMSAWHLTSNRSFGRLNGQHWGGEEPKTRRFCIRCMHPDRFYKRQHWHQRCMCLGDLLSLSSSWGCGDH